MKTCAQLISWVKLYRLECRPVSHVLSCQTRSPRPGRVGFTSMVDEVAVGQFSVWTLRFSPVIVLLPMLPKRSFVYHCRFVMLAVDSAINPLNPELNPICYLLALLGAHHFFHVSRIRVKLLTFRRLMSQIYGAPILDVSRSHTTTQHSR